MSAEEQTAGAEPPPNNASPVLLIAAVAASAVAALVATISFVVLLSVSGSVSSLQAQVRKLSQAAKSMGEELEQIKAATAPVAAPAQARPAPSPPRPSHMDAGDPARDCIVRPGSKNPLGDCLK